MSLLLVAAGVLSPPSAAQPLAARAEPKLQLAPELELRAGAHSVIEAIVQLPAPNDAPLLLTPSVEGHALEVVRGRLTRSDARALDPTRLRFEIPVLARSEGTAIVRVDVMTYLCENTCRRVMLRASQVVRVR